jgi:uncharacterized protein (TIGR02217 family)
MAFFECEFPRAISYKAVGGPAASTYVVGVESGAEQRNRNWANFRARYTISMITPVGYNDTRQTFFDQLRTFFYLIGGKTDGFRFYDHLDHSATGQSVTTIDTKNFQLQRVYSLGGRSYTRPITKPITSSVIDYTGASLLNTVRIKVGGSLASPQPDVDEETGIVTFDSAPGGTVTADFEYHIPVRLDTDDCQLQVEDSDVAGGKPIISWNSLTLIEVRPPNY